MKKETGFTLAEVLITLGIIGVVAAITIPVLMNNIQDAQFKTAYKKAYSAASQALQKASVDNLLVPMTGEGDSNNGQNFLNFMNQFKLSKKCINNDYQNCWDDNGEKFGLQWNSTGFPQHPVFTYAFVDSSGMAWAMYYNSCFIVFVDTNGFKKPNQWGKDRFALRPVNENNQVAIGLPIKIIPYGDWSNSVSSGLTYNHLCLNNQCSIDKTYYGTSWLYN